MEPLLKENPQRFVIYPIKYHDIWSFYKKEVSLFWVTEEIQTELSKDYKDFLNLNPNEQLFIKNVLGFFSNADGIVNENLASRFINEVQIPEARFFYGFQIMMENIHSETYSLLLDTFIRDPLEKDKLFNAIETVPAVKKKANWALKWLSSERSFAERLIAFACVEGIFFSGSFCAIFWLKERNLMPGLTKSNEFISRDEGLHTDFAVLLYTKYIKHKLYYTLIQEIVKEAVEIETEFITESLPCNLIGMNSELMKEYIRFVSDRLLTQLKVPKIFNATCPFPFMEGQSLGRQTNFFESINTSYSNHSAGKSVADLSFTISEDF